MVTAGMRNTIMRLNVSAIPLDETHTHTHTQRKVSGLFFLST